MRSPSGRKGSRGGTHASFPLVLVLIALFAIAASTQDDGLLQSFYIVFSTECTPYFDWQTLGLLHSYERANQTGRITRLMACDDENYEGKDLTARFSNADTYVHKNYATHPVSGDVYPAYNKPYSILSYLRDSEPEEDFIVFLDADMVIVSEITVDAVGAKLGKPVSALYGYLKGVDPESYMEIKESVPNVERADKVGGFMVMHKEDMKKLAPWWLHYTEEVRTNPKNWANTGDVFNQNGALGPPWISEMYGYVFGCAHVNLSHTISNDFMLYPGYNPPSPPFPLVLHYGITFFVDDYAFDKHWFDDLTTCPGKNVDYPLGLEEIAYKRSAGASGDYRRAELALYAPRMIHEALEDHHKHYCHADHAERFRHTFQCAVPQGIIRCNATGNLHGEGLEQKIERNEGRGASIAQAEAKPPVEPAACEDTHDQCCSWARGGECQTNANFMLQRCRMSCGLCGEASASCEPGQGGAGEGSSPGGGGGSAGSSVRNPTEDGHGLGHFFGRDRHVFHHHDHRETKPDPNLFNGANEALFLALPFWGSLCVVGVVAAALVHTMWPSIRRRIRRGRHKGRTRLAV